MSTKPSPTSNDVTTPSFIDSTNVNESLFPFLLQELIKSIESNVQQHQDIHDTWTRLVKQGITQPSMCNVPDICRILQCRNTIFNIVSTLMATFPFLKSQWVCSFVSNEEIAISRISHDTRITRNAVYSTVSGITDDKHVSGIPLDPDNTTEEPFQTPKKTFRPDTNKQVLTYGTIATINKYSPLIDDEDQDDTPNSEDENISFDDSDLSKKSPSASPTSRPDSSNESDINLYATLLNTVREHVANGKIHNLSINDIATWIEDDSIQWIDNFATAIVDDKMETQLVEKTNSARRQLTNYHMDLTEKMHDECNDVGAEIISMINRRATEIVQPQLQSIQDKIDEYNRVTAIETVKMQDQKEAIYTLLEKMELAKQQLASHVDGVQARFNGYCRSTVSDHMKEMNNYVPPSMSKFKSSSHDAPIADAHDADDSSHHSHLPHKASSSPSPHDNDSGFLSIGTTVKIV